MSEYRANFLWHPKQTPLESLGYDFANAKTEEYRKEVWKELIKHIPISDNTKCDDCPKGINCSGCFRFSKHCKKCTNG